MKFKRDDGKFDVERFKAAVRIFITAQEIIVDNASYPDQGNRGELAHLPHPGPGLRQPRLAHHELRPALRFRRRPRPGRRHHRHHDRPRLRAIRRIAASWGRSRATRTPAAPVSKPLAKDNVELHARRHPAASRRRRGIHPSSEFAYLKDEARHCWDRALERGRQAGYRNAQVTVLAPPAPSPSSWIATPPASSRTSRWSNINCWPAAAC
jgi:ribonucleoside-diphosphate reductase alpha chain